MALRRAKKMGKKGAIFGSSTWGGQEISLGGVPQGLGTEVLMGKLTLGEWIVFWEVNSQQSQGSPEGSQLHVARESLIITNFPRCHRPRDKELLEGAGRAGPSSMESLKWTSSLFVHYVSLEILRTAPRSPALSTFLVLEFRFESSISRQDHCGLQLWPSLTDPCSFSLTPESCALWCPRPWQAISTFSFRPGQPWIPVILISAKYHICSGHVC